MCFMVYRQINLIGRCATSFNNFLPAPILLYGWLRFGPFDVVSFVGADVGCNPVFGAAFMLRVELLERE